MSTSSPSPALQTPPDVEEYSLTLLRYRQYFTEKPLGRSLDDVWASDHLPNNTSRGGKAFSINPTSSRETRTLPKREEQNGHQIQKEQKVQGPQRHHEEASKASSDSSIANYTPLIHRDPHEVEAFWRHVQDYLWIPGEELDDDTASILSQPEARQSTGEEPSRRDSASRNDGTTQSGSSVHSPLDRQTHSRLSVSSGNPKANRRRRLLSTEEKMSEIDAFLNEGGADGLEQVSSHINSSPPERQSGNPVDVGAGEAAEPRPQRCTSCLKLKTGGSPSS